MSETLHDVLGLGGAQDHQDRFYGKYRGTVADNQDPEGLGRIQAKVPAVLHDVQSGWATPCTPYAAQGAGLFTIPPNGSGVWIEFEAGDTSRPIWSGCWWSTSEVPQDEQSTDSTPGRKILRSDQNLLVSLDDDAQTISVSDGNGQNILSIQVNQGQVELKGATAAIIEAPLIKHGEGAQHPAVFGDELLTYLNQLVSLFNSHVHPGQLAAGVLPVTPAPPVAPFTPATPSLISTKNMVE
jgi:uncharacterized protein involved in type VI secretion and phage assembly